MWLFILRCFYFILPAYFANMAPVIVKDRFRGLAIPINKNLFGENKTIRGFIFGIFFAMIITFLQFLLYRFNFFRNIVFVDYSNWFVVGFLFGFGALFGDLIESFVKRRLEIKAGERFVPWDQLDFIFGALIFISFVVILTLKMILVIIVISLIGHILVNHTAYYLKVRKEKW